MSQESIDAVKLTVSRTFEWISRLIQALLLAALLWFGAEVVELRTLVAVLTTRLEANTQLAGANLLAVIQRVDQNDKRDDRQQDHIEAVDARVRELERGAR